MVRSESGIRYEPPLVYVKTGGEWFCYSENHAPLGQGAMGTVYPGRGVASGRRVAVKRVPDRYLHIPQVRKRAHLEADLMFRHRHLVEMVGCCDPMPPRGPLFLVSNLVQGMTIDRYVALNFAGKPDRVRRICMLLRPVAEALDFIHAKGVVHMDVKPSNIMVENGCNVRLMDLGIAYMGGTIPMSQAGLIGTSGYAAPEQYYSPSSGGVEVDPRTDVYELGVTLYELVTGRRVPGHNIPSEPSGVPPALMRVISRAVDSDRNARWPSAGEFMTEAVRALDRPEPKSDRWRVAAVVAASCVALLLFILFLIWQRQ